MSKRAYYAAWSIMALTLALIFVSEAIAKPESVVAGLLKAYKTQGFVVEVRKQKDDQTHDIVLLRNGQIRAYNLPKGKPRQLLTPSKTYNVDKIKELAAKVPTAIERANYTVSQNPALKNKRPILRAITIRENAEGKLEFLVHCYHPTDAGYRLSYVVNTETWQMAKDSVTVDDPRDEEWGTPMSADEAAAIEAADKAAIEERDKPAEGGEGDKPEADNAEGEQTKGDKPEATKTEQPAQPRARRGGRGGRGGSGGENAGSRRTGTGGGEAAE